MLSRTILWPLLALLCSCNSNRGDRPKPTGTPTDPVVLCERHGQVCKFDTSQLGVCVEAQSEAAKAKCEGRFPCLFCAPQH